ncbi:hypothetical protein PLESTF_000288100 [Pleodorina starrii]|nr:hypothetical protein PLESTF_000288100 [Pleodorina starrii]
MCRAPARLRDGRSSGGEGLGRAGDGGEGLGGSCGGGEGLGGPGGGGEGLGCPGDGGEGLGGVGDGGEGLGRAGDGGEGLGGPGDGGEGLGGPGGGGEGLGGVGDGGEWLGGPSDGGVAVGGAGSAGAEARYHFLLPRYGGVPAGGGAPYGGYPGSGWKPSAWSHSIEEGGRGRRRAGGRTHEGPQAAAPRAVGPQLSDRRSVPAGRNPNRAAAAPHWCHVPGSGLGRPSGYGLGTGRAAQEQALGAEANVLGEVREAVRQRQRPDAPADMGTLVERIKAYPGRGRSEQRICLQYATSGSCTRGPRGCKFAHPVPGLLGHMLAGLPPG